MNPDISTDAALVVIVSASLLFTACSRPERDIESSKRDVAIHSPIGDLSVRTDIDTRETGLPVYPGAQPLRDSSEGDSAHVTVTTPLFGLDVVAAKYETADASDLVTEFYRREMRTYGDVIECRGDVDFKVRRAARDAICNQNATTHELKLAVGTEHRHRTVSVVRRGSGSEFSVVYVHTRETR
jgi:hypothetical protein